MTWGEAEVQGGAYGRQARVPPRKPKAGWSSLAGRISWANRAAEKRSVSPIAYSRAAISQARGSSVTWTEQILRFSHKRLGFSYNACCTNVVTIQVTMQKSGNAYFQETATTFTNNDAAGGYVEHGARLVTIDAAIAANSGFTNGVAFRRSWCVFRSMLTADSV